MTLRSMYFILAIAGAIIPYGFFISFGIDYGLDPGVFLTAPFANAAAGGFTADLLMSSIVFWLYVFSRVGDNGPAPWLFIALNLCVGLSCALPAYFWACSSKAEGFRGID